MQSSIREAWLSQIFDARYMIRRGFLAQTRKKCSLHEQRKRAKVSANKITF